MKTIGIDFDNTLVIYDELFYKLAIERDLIPKNLSKNKIIIRNYLRAINKDEQFTNLQKVPISLENNLKNPSISFYTPDNTIPDADNIYKTAGPSQPQVGSLPNIFATLVDINLNSETVRPLRAFGGLSYVW